MRSIEGTARASEALAEEVALNSDFRVGGSRP